MRLSLLAIVAAASALTAAPALAAPTVYTSSAAFAAAASGTPLTFESFESAPGAGSTATSLTFGGLTFSCAGSNYCPGFFGRNTALPTDGSNAVYFATNDTATFTFSQAITSFGVDVIGLGDVGSTNFFLNVGTGPLALQTNYSAVGGTVTFAGVIDPNGFTSVTFSGTRDGDGVFFDALNFGGTPGGAVPEPATWALLIGGIGLTGGMMRRRRSIVRTALRYA